MPITENKLAYLVHDIRSMATSVSLMVDLLELAAKAGDDPTQRARAVSAQGSCQQMTQICAEIAKHMNGCDSANSESMQVDLLGLLREINAIYSPIFDLAGKTIELDFASRSIEISGNYSQIFRAVSNLVDNALKHTSKGSAVVIACSDDISETVITVSDNGPGLDDLEAGAVQTIYSLPVVTRHISTSGSIFSPGTGLRLVSETVAAHNGVATAELNERGGSSFKLRFPDR